MSRARSKRRGGGRPLRCPLLLGLGTGRALGVEVGLALSPAGVSSCGALGARELGKLGAFGAGLLTRGELGRASHRGGCRTGKGRCVVYGLC